MVINTPISVTPIIACHTCSIFTNAKQLIFNQYSEVIDLDLEKDLKQKAKEIPNYISVQDLPDPVKLLLVDYNFKTDAKGNECLYLYLKTKGNDVITQKYTQSGYEEILDAINKAGGSEHLKLTLSEWKRAIVGRMQRQRLTPIAKEKEQQ